MVFRGTVLEVVDWIFPAWDAVMKFRAPKKRGISCLARLLLAFIKKGSAVGYLARME